jgi:hypothetical protein
MTIDLHRSDGLLNPWNVLSTHSTFRFRRSDRHILQHAGESIAKMKCKKQFCLAQPDRYSNKIPEHQREQIRLRGFAGGFSGLAPDD